MNKFLLATVALSALVAAPAMAADLARPVYKAAPPVYVYSWTGCYIGGNGGGMWVHKDYALTSAVVGGFGGIVGPGLGLGSHDTSSGIGGFQGGCNYQVGGWVFGIQGDVDWSNAIGSHVDPFGGLTTLRSKTKSLASVTGRVGYAWDRFLGYVKGGGAWEWDDYSWFLTGVPAVPPVTGSETRGGWTVGVGGEYAFTDWLSAFVEYDYYGFGTRTVGLNSAAVTANFDIKDSKSVVKAGLNFKFSANPVVAKY
jgi:outer membrane immunogenic protein